MWKPTTYADVIATDSTKTKFYKYETFSEITLPQSLININGHWYLEKPRTRTPEEKQQEPDQERFLVPINVDDQIRQTHLAGNPYTLFKKGKTRETSKQLTQTQEAYQESVAAIQQVDGRDAVWQIRQKRNDEWKIELVDRNLQQDGFTMDLFDYINQLEISENPYEALLQRLWIAYNALSLLNWLHTQKDRTHGDFKPENIMVNPQTGVLRLIDFDFSKKGPWIPAFRGSPTYAAPEVCLPILFPNNLYVQKTEDSPYYAVHRNADNFAAGVVLSILVGIVEPWNDRADSIMSYRRIIQKNPQTIADKQFHNEYSWALRSAITILDQSYSCKEEEDEAISAHLIEMATAFQLDEQFVDANENVLMHIINIIAHLTRFNPQDRIGLDKALPVLGKTIRELDQGYQATKQAAAVTTPEPELLIPPNAEPQDMDIDGEPGPAQPIASPLTGTSG